MEINYLDSVHSFLAQNPNSGKGVASSDVAQLESKLKNGFPKIYKEFLVLCGDGFDPISGLNLGFYPIGNNKKQLWIEVQQENALYNLKEYGFESLIPRDFWVVAEMEGSDYIHYIHFDEGENPPVYGLSMADYEDEPTEEYHKKIADSFSEYIQGFIDRYDPRYD